MLLEGLNEILSTKCSAAPGTSMSSVHANEQCPCQVSLEPVHSKPPAVFLQETWSGHIFERGTRAGVGLGWRWNGKKWIHVFTGSLKTWNENTKNPGISGKGRVCANPRIGWKVGGCLRLRKEQNKHHLIPRLVARHGDLSRTPELVARNGKALKTSCAHRTHPAGHLWRAGECCKQPAPASTSHFQKLLPVSPTILPFPEP